MDFNRQRAEEGLSRRGRYVGRARGPGAQSEHLCPDEREVTYEPLRFEKFCRSGSTGPDSGAHARKSGTVQFFVLNQVRLRISLSLVGSKSLVQKIVGTYVEVCQLQMARASHVD